MATRLFRPQRAASPNGHGPAAPEQRAGPTPPSSAPMLVPPAGRRRPAMLIAGLMLAAIGAVVAATTAMAAGDRSPVLVVTHDVAAGARLTDADLAVARVADDPHLHPVAASALASVVGQRAATALTAGTLLTRGMLSSQPAPAAGTAIVPVALKPSQLPARPLQPGDRLLVVPAVADGAPQPASSVMPVAATVGEIGTPTDDGTVVLDLQVDEGQAALLAQLAAGGHVALVLLPGGES